MISRRTEKQTVLSFKHPVTFEVSTLKIRIGSSKSEVLKCERVPVSFLSHFLACM